MTSTEGSPSPTIRHVVHIRLDPSLDEAARTALETDLAHLVEQHPHAGCAALHRDLGRRPNAPVSATWMVVMDFRDMSAFEAYLIHPLHADFLATHQPSMAYISAIQVPIADDAGAASGLSTEARSRDAATR